MSVIPDKKEPETIDAKTGRPDPTPPVKRRRIDLSSLRDVRLELAAVYRRVDRGQLDSADASKRAFILRNIADLIVFAELERRVEDLETATGPQPVVGRSVSARLQ